MKTVEERTQEADKCVKEFQRQQRVAQRQAKDKLKKKEQQRNYIIGELVCKYFPEVREIEPGATAETTERFKLVELFIAELAADKQLVEQVKGRAHRRGEWC